LAPRCGNLKTRLDARGKLATYGYDALNRLTSASYGDQTVSYVWDACANGLGRLCQVIAYGALHFESSRWKRRSG
jgi:YD repeat-containing protein